MRAMSSKPVAEAIAACERPCVVYTTRNLTIDWYSGTWIDYAIGPGVLGPWIEAHPRGCVIAVEDDIARLARLEPKMAARLRERARFDVWPMKKLLMLDVVR